MKLKKFKSKQLLKLHLLNSRAHAVKKMSSSVLMDFSLTQTLNDFKKILHIIFQYHRAKKKILFIGVPKEFGLKLNSLGQHVATDNTFDLQGFTFHSSSSSDSSKATKQISFKSLAMLKKPDLVVLLSHHKAQSIVKEGTLARIPIISFNTNDKINSLKNFYTVKNLDKDIGSTYTETIFLLGLNFLFKRLEKNSN